MTDRESRIMVLIDRYGGIDGAHHLRWLLSEIARTLLGDDYPAWVAARPLGSNGEPGYYSPWDEGIPP